MTARRVRGGGGLVLWVCLVLVVVITALTPDPAEDVRRRWNDVTLGQWGQMDQTGARVTRVQLTRSTVNSYDRTIVSAVTFVVLDYEVRVSRKQMSFSAVTLATADGRQYTPRAEFPGLGATQPGFTRRGSLVFEVPDERVAGSRLVIDRDKAGFDVYSAGIRIDLDLRRKTAVGDGPIPVVESVVEVTP